MGLHLTMTAFRDVPADELAREVMTWFDGQAYTCTPSAADAATLSHWDALAVHAPVGGWTLVQWPSLFGSYAVGSVGQDSLVSHLTARLGTVASSMAVYDSDSWTHVVHEHGTVRDQYATDWRVSASGLDDPREVRHAWRGNPDEAARVLGGSARDVARHYRRNRRAWSYDDWDFVELWRECGITYPEADAPVELVAELDPGWFDLMFPR